MLYMKHLLSYKDFLKESLHNISETELEKAHQIFKDIFDSYLRAVSPRTYPMIYHCTEFKHYDSINNNGLNYERNYFLDCDNNHNMYGFSDEGDEVPGISCAVDYHDVIDRLYIDPEYMLDIIHKTGNPSTIIDDRIVFYYWLTDVMNIYDFDDDISEININKCIKERMFHWLYVKGKVSPNLIKIHIHEDLRP